MEIEYLFLVKKQRRDTEVITRDGSVGARVDNGDLFVYHRVVMEYSASFQNINFFFSLLKKPITILYWEGQSRYKI